MEPTYQESPAKTPARSLDPNLLYVFVLCPSYHGATLLALLLGQHREIVDLGDTNPSLGQDWYCRCGQSVASCDFWLQLRRALEPPIVGGDTHWLPKRPPFTNSSRANGLLSYVAATVSALTRGKVACAMTSRVKRYRDATLTMALTATAMMGARVFVDGEKSIEKALCLSATSRMPVRVIHLTRDPRGYAVSAKSRDARSGRPTRAVDHAMEWRRYHSRVRYLRRVIGSDKVLTIRYEDLATTTESTLRQVLEFIGVPPLGPGTQRPDDVPLHAIGNKLLKTYDGKIELDDRWRSTLSEAEGLSILQHSGRFAADQGYL